MRRGVTLVVALLVVWGVVGWFFLPALLVVPLRQVGYWWSGIHDRTVMVDGHRWTYLECLPQASGGAAAANAGAAQPADAPVLLMLHGFGTSKDAMMSMMRPVADRGYRVLAPDLPGFGGHPFHEGQVHDASFYTAQLAAFMDAVHAPNAVVAGTSMGGALAAELALDDPARVRALVLLSPAGVVPPMRNAFMQAVDRGENPLDIRDPESFDRVTAAVFRHPPYVPRPLRAWLTGRAVSTRQHTLEIVEAMRAFLYSGLEGRLQEIQIPALVIYGAQDAVTDPSMLEVFRAGLPDARCALVEDAGHVAFYDNWPDVWREFGAFLDAVGSH